MNTLEKIKAEVDRWNNLPIRRRVEEAPDVLEVITLYIDMENNNEEQ